MAGGKAVTLRQVAEATGFSAVTVSRALKDNPIISEATRTLIQQTARQMGYTRNRAAAALREGRSHTLACIVGSVANPYFGMLFETVSKVAEEMGYTTILLTTHEEPANEKTAIRAAISYAVDGILLASCVDTDESVRLMRGSGIPFVLLARECVSAEADCVLCNEDQGGALMAQHLIDAGHRKLMYMCDYGIIYSIERRCAGFVKTARAAGIPEEDIRLVVRTEKDDERSAVQQTAEIARLYHEGFTAVAVFCDMQSHYLFRELRKYHIRMPSDLACIGYDNIDSLVPSAFPTCSIGCDYTLLCRHAVQLLHRRIHGDNGPVQRIEVPAFIVCRDTCHRS